MFAIVGLIAAAPAWAQSGLRLPELAEPGLDPSSARIWLAPEYDRFGFAAYQWRDAYGFGPTPRLRWSYALGERGNFSMSLANNGRDSEIDHRPVSVYGRYWIAPNWAVSAESLSRD